MPQDSTEAKKSRSTSKLEENWSWGDVALVENIRQNSCETSVKAWEETFSGTLMRFKQTGPTARKVSFLPAEYKRWRIQLQLNV